ncbi:MAG: DUF4397 domain-containing protein [Bacteroidota bacterium]
MKNFVFISFGRKTAYAATVLLTATFCLFSCKKEDSPPEPIGNAQVMFVHAVADAPDMEIAINDKRQSTVLDSLSATNYLTIEAGSKIIKLNEAGTSKAPYVTVNQSLIKNMYYSVFAVNQVSSVETLVLVDSLDKVASGKTFIRFIHLAPAAPDVQIALVNTDNTLGQTIIPSTAYKKYTNFRAQDAGSLKLAVQKTSDLSVVYTTPAYNYEAGKFYTVIAQGWKTQQGNDSLTTRVIANRK